MDILENINELGNKISNDLNLKNIQDKFLNSTLGQIANTAIDVGIKIMLPDYLENEVIEVKDALISEGLNEGINTAIENAIKIGKKMIGMENKEFVSIEQAIKAVGEGNVIKNISEGIDTVLNKVTDSNIIPSDITNKIKEGKNELTISTVRKAVCDYYNLTKQQITSANRTKNISNARQIAMYLSRKLLDATYDDIGREFGGRDHSTVMSSCENVERKIKVDPLYLKAINEIETKIK